MTHTRDTVLRRKASVLGAGTALAMGLACLAQTPALAQSAGQAPAFPPKACLVMELLVSDEVSGPAPGNGEVIRIVGSAGLSTLTTNTAPPGNPTLDSPADMAFDLNGNIVTADEAGGGGVSQVVRIDRNTGARTLVSGPSAGSGPALNGPDSIAVEPTGDILVLNWDTTLTLRQLVRITPTGTRSTLLSATAVGGTSPRRVRVLNGVIYMIEPTQLVSVNPISGATTVISGGGRGTGPAFAGLRSATTDATTSSVIVLDQAFDGTGALIRVDLASGNRTLLSSNAIPAGPAYTAFDMPFDVVRDGCRNTFDVLHSGSSVRPGYVLEVDGNTGLRTRLVPYTTLSAPAFNYSLLIRPVMRQIGSAAGAGAGRDL